MSAFSPSALLRVGRLPNALIAAAGVLVGAWWAGATWHWVPAAYAVVGAIFLSFAAYAWNDADDVEIDRVAHPDRPIPRGDLSVQAATRFALVSALLGVLLSSLARPVLGVLALIVVVAMRGYSAAFKWRGLPGNLVVAIIASLPFLWGAWAVGLPERGLPLVAIAVPLHFAREVAKDIDDARGDAGHRRTVPLAFGMSAARGAMLAAVVAFIVLLAPLVIAQPLFALAILPAILLAAAATGFVWRGAHGGPTLLKAAMLLAMAALVVVRI